MIRQKHVLNKNCAIIWRKDSLGYYATLFWGWRTSQGKFELYQCHSITTKRYAKLERMKRATFLLCRSFGLTLSHTEDWVGKEK
jgi:hypothetical protein